MRRRLTGIAWSIALLLTIGCEKEEYEDGAPQGPEPTVWIGLAEDIGE